MFTELIVLTGLLSGCVCIQGTPPASGQVSREEDVYRIASPRGSKTPLLNAFGDWPGK